MVKPAIENAVSYLRVSTAMQGKSGLGLEAQREAVARYLANTGGVLLKEFEEVETGKGSDALDKRPQLRAAIALAKKKGVVLVIAKLDRLARNVHFITGLMEQGVQFKCCDYPTADSFMLHIYASVAEHEGKRISTRIKDALAAKKANGGTLGNAATLQPFNGARAAEAAQFAAKVAPAINAFRQQKMTQREVMGALNAVGIKTARGGDWSLVQVQRVLQRLA